MARMPLPHWTPEVRTLELLLSTARLRSVGAAAREHGISQPAASERLRNLERSIGVPLLERTPRGSSLTSQGALVAEWAMDVVAAAGRLDDGIAALRQDQRSALRVAASMTIAEYLAPRWLPDVSRLHPGLDVALTVLNSSAVADAVLARTAHIGFVEGSGVPRGLASKGVARDELVVVVWPEHAWARRRAPVTGAELAATAFVLREKGSGTRETFERAVRVFGRMCPPVLEASTTTSVKAAVAARSGPEVVSSLAVVAELRDGSLRRVPVDVPLQRSLRAVWPRNGQLSAPARDLLTVAGRLGSSSA
jgi:DNA-binding transcriptional LysR family regulator